ncbi:MAG: MFS transporter [bacterium]
MFGRKRKKNRNPASMEERNIRANNWNGLFASINSNMVNNFLGIYARDLGAGSFQFGLLTSLPALVTTFTILPGLPLVERLRDKMRFTAVLALAGRLFYLLFALASFFQPSVWLLLIFVALAALPNAWSGLSWTALIGESISQEKRATAFSARNRLISIFGILATMAAGQMMEALAFPWSYRVVFASAFLFALFEVYTLLLLKPLHLEKIPTSRVGVGQLIRGNPLYRQFLIGSLLFQVGFQFTLPLFTIYTLRDLGASPIWVSLIVIVSGVAQVAAYPLWARWSHRFGGIAPLVWSLILMSLTPLLYASVNSLWPLLLFNLVAGFGWSGFNLISFNTLLETCPLGARERGIAIYNFFMNLTAILLPLLGVALADWIGIRWALAVGATLRLGGVAYFFSTGRDHFGAFLLPKGFSIKKGTLV